MCCVVVVFERERTGEEEKERGGREGSLEEMLEEAQWKRNEAKKHAISQRQCKNNEREGRTEKKNSSAREARGATVKPEKGNTARVVPENTKKKEQEDSGNIQEKLLYFRAIFPVF